MTWRCPGFNSVADFLRARLKPVPNHYLSNRMPIPTRNNVVMDVSLAREPNSKRKVFSRQDIIARFPGSQITPQFGAVIVRYGPPTLTMLLWENTSIVVIGEKSVNQGVLGVQHFRIALAEMGLVTHLRDISVNNRVYNFDLCTVIDTPRLEEVNECLFFADFDVFPGTFHYSRELELCMLFFDTGKGVGMGSAPEDTIMQYMRSIFPIVMRYAIDGKRVQRPKRSSEKSSARDTAQRTRHASELKRTKAVSQGTMSTFQRLFREASSDTEVKQRYNVYHQFLKNGVKAMKDALEEYRKRYGLVAYFESTLASITGVPTEVTIPSKARRVE